MSEKIRGLAIEGEFLKRWRVVYGGDAVGSYNTATEALKEYRNYEDKIRPVIHRERKYSYKFHDGRNEITLHELRRAAQAEEAAETKSEK